MPPYKWMLKLEGQEKLDELMLLLERHRQLASPMR